MENEYNLSYLNFYKTLASLASIDGIVTVQEEKFIQELLDHSRLNGSDKLSVTSLLSEKSDPFTFLDNINEPAKLSQLHHMANVLFHKDDFDVKEKEFLNRFLNHLTSKIDMMSALRKVEDYQSQKLIQEKKDLERASGLFLTLVEFYKKL